MNTVILQQPRRLLFGSGCLQRSAEAHVFRFHLPPMPERYADIARALGVAPAATPLATTEAGLARLVELSSACGIPRRLRDVKVPEADLPRLAGEAMKVQRLLKNNPREITATDAIAIYQQAF